MIKITLKDILEREERSINYLSSKTKIPYATLYKYINEKSPSLKLSHIDSICNCLNIEPKDFIKHVKDQ